MFTVLALRRENSHTLKLTLWKRIAQRFSDCSQSCASVSTLSFQNLLAGLKARSQEQSVPIPLPQPPAATCLLSVPMDLLVLDVSPKWNHTRVVSVPDPFCP